MAYNETPTMRGTTMKKINLKKKISDHREAIIAGACFTAVVGIYVAIAIAAAKQQVEMQRQLEEAVAAGKTILPNPDGSFWILDMQ